MQAAREIAFGKFRLDLTNECLWQGTRSISLRPKAFSVLKLLLEHPGRLVSKQEVLDTVWPGTFVGDAVLKDNIRQLREALQDDAGRVTGLIGTCRDVTEERQRGQQIRLYADIARNVQIGLSVWSVEEGHDGLSIRLLAFNPASERIAGMDLSPFLRRPFREIAPYAADGEVESLLVRVARERQVHEASVERSGDPRHPTRALSIKGFPLPGRSVGLAIEDVTTQVVEGRLRSAEHNVLEMIAAGAPLGDSLAAVVRAVEEHSPPVIGSVLLLDDDGAHLRHGAAGPIR